MNGFDALLRYAGPWEGTNRLQVTPADPIQESRSQLLITPILSDTFIRIDQAWSWNDQPQSGSMLIGCARKSGIASIHWIDTWHNGTRVMPLDGKFDGNGVLIALGRFAVDGSPDWSWRIEIRPQNERLNIDMFCVNPQNNADEGGVKSEFRRVAK